MKTHSNGCKPRIAITLSGWNTSPSIRSLIAIAPTIVFKSSSGESTCSELDYEIPDALPQLPPERYLPGDELCLDDTSAFSEVRLVSRVERNRGLGGGWKKPAEGSRWRGGRECQGLNALIHLRLLRREIPRPLTRVL